MAATIRYNNDTVTSVTSSGTVTLDTNNKWMEGDIEVEDTTSIESLSVTPGAEQ